MPCGFHAASSPWTHLLTSIPLLFQFPSRFSLMVSYQLRPLVFFFFNHSSCCAINFGILVDPGHRRSAACKNLVRKSDSAVVAEGERFERVSIFPQPSVKQRKLNSCRPSTPRAAPNTLPNWNVRPCRMRVHSQKWTPAPAWIDDDSFEAVYFRSLVHRPRAVLRWIPSLLATYQSSRGRVSSPARTCP
jgi:hypothetical protein